MFVNKRRDYVEAPRVLNHTYGENLQNKQNAIFFGERISVCFCVKERIAFIVIKHMWEFQKCICLQTKNNKAFSI